MTALALMRNGKESIDNSINSSINIVAMTDIERLVEAMRQSPANVRFSDLCKICNYYFGEARQRGSSHRAYKTPWPGDPRANVQNGKGRKTKAYQVRQVIPAIDKLKGLSDG